VLDLFCRGETKGIFQFESGGNAGPADEDAAGPPGRSHRRQRALPPRADGADPDLLQPQAQRERVPVEHPIMDKILEETYGIMVYQEQVMQIFNQLGRHRAGQRVQADQGDFEKDRRRDRQVPAAVHQGMRRQGIEQVKAQEIFELILKFGGYGFNKSHSTRYAIVAFQTRT
jgi:DNA polymerase-3 subunit alpha